MLFLEIIIEDMGKENITKIGAKLTVQTIAIILFLAVCTYFIMKLIDKESDSLSLFLIGFGGVFVFIVLLAIYIKYVVNIYYQIKSANLNPEPSKISIAQNEKKHMKIVHHANNVNQKKKGNKKKSRK